MYCLGKGGSLSNDQLVEWARGKRMEKSTPRNKVCSTVPFQSPNERLFVWSPKELVFASAEVRSCHPPVPSEARRMAITNALAKMIFRSHFQDAPTSFRRGEFRLPSFPRTQKTSKLTVSRTPPGPSRSPKALQELLALHLETGPDRWRSRCDALKRVRRESRRWCWRVRSKGLGDEFC